MWRARLRRNVVQMIMNKTSLSFVVIAVLVTGCASLDRTDDVNNPVAWDIHDQIQHAAALAALRYAEVLHDLSEGRVNEALESTDWWLDQAILLLGRLEAEHPEREWANRPIHEDGTLQMSRIYKDIANKRLQYPRSHKVPLEPNELDMISDFVERYR